MTAASTSTTCGRCHLPETRPGAACAGGGPTAGAGRVHGDLRPGVRSHGGVWRIADGSWNDTWTLGWSAITSVPQDVPGRIEMGALRPNPTRSETTVDFRLSEPGTVVLDVFDARGRRVKRIVDDWFPAGRHVSTWLGDDDSGNAVGSGVYFVRLQQGGSHASQLTVRIR